MLKIEKKAFANYDFDDGLKLSFNDSKPSHLQFWCKTNSNYSESCNVRLFKANQSEIESWRKTPE